MDATDLKLIELAGKAAGEHYTQEANPLDSDALAFRLAVKLRMQILRDGLEVTAEAPLDFGGSAKCSFVEHDNLDAEAATRRAIVRAAAALGGQGEP